MSTGSRLDNTMKWLAANREQLNSISKERERVENRERVGRYRKARFGDDPEYKRVLSFRSRFLSFLFKKWKTNPDAKPRKTNTHNRLFGCSWQEFRDHVESQFQEGMHWDNHGRGSGKWVLDHIRPICLFDWWTWEGLKEAFHWSNIQPLWGWQHRAKTDFDNALARKRRMEDKDYASRLNMENGQASALNS